MKCVYLEPIQEWRLYVSVFPQGADIAYETIIRPAMRIYPPYYRYLIKKAFTEYIQYMKSGVLNDTSKWKQIEKVYGRLIDYCIKKGLIQELY